MNKTDIAEMSYMMLTGRRVAHEGSVLNDWLDQSTNWREAIVRMVEYIINNPSTTPEQYHQAWVKDQKDHGWIWGSEYSSSMMTHPALIAYGKLSKEQQLETELFLSIVKTLAPWRDGL